MRVLHVDTGRELRGGQWQVFYLLKGLAAAGHTSLLLAPRLSPLYEMASSQGWEVRPVGLASLARLSRRVDLTHLHDARAHTLAALAARGPWVVARRVAFPVRRDLISRWKYTRARHYIAVSKHVQQTLTAAGVAAEKISVVYDGVPISAASPGGSWVVAPATEDPQKGSALLRQAAALARLEVRFSDNLAEDLAHAAVFVYITHQEGLGSAVLLAMAMGVPVVASRTGGLSELIEDARTGLATDNAPQAIASALKRVLDDRSFALQLAARARQRVQEHFSAEAMVRNTLQVYERLLSC
jgi:glycosyltransferase involved in cell wall biosynthesis